MKKKQWISYTFVLPYMLIFFVFTVLPVLISIVLSFTDFNLLEIPNFVGAENYKRLFLEDDIFIKSIGNTLILAVIVGPVGYLLCLLFAWFINDFHPIIRSIITLVFYAPSISGNAYLIWQVMFSGDAYGYFNGMLLDLGIISEPILWLKNPDYMMPILLFVALWASLGTSFLVFIAAFQGVDKALIEAGRVDGIKNRWQELWYITMPSMKPQMMFSAVMSIVNAFGAGAVATAMMGFPSADYATHTMINHLEDFGNTRYEMGYASAIATVLFILMVVCNRAFSKLLSKVGT